MSCEQADFAERAFQRVEMTCDVSVGGFWYACVQLHGEPAGGVTEASLDHRRMLALLDQKAGGYMAEQVEGERRI